MKYGEYLEHNRTPEWRNQYIDYSFLNTQIEKFRIMEPSTVDYISIKAEFVESFQRKLRAELIKINQFYLKQTVKNDKLWHEIQDMVENVPNIIETNSDLPITEASNSRRKIKKFVCEFYYALHLLERYAEANKEGLRKILKKFDKVVFDDTFGLKVEVKNQIGQKIYRDEVKKCFDDKKTKILTFS